MARWLLVLLLLLASCGGSEPEPGSTTSAGCPEIPEIRPTEHTDVIWPSTTVRGVVPDFEDICATPTAPHLFILLNETASWSSELQAAAHGVLHRATEEVATFSVIRLPTEFIASAEEHVRSQEATTTAGDMALAWGGTGPHVVVTWVDDQTIVTVAAEGAESAAEATELWLRSSGVDASVTAPEEVPQIIEIPPELAKGPPLEELPEGYAALPIDPASFAGSDFAERVKIQREKGLEVLGASIILADGGRTLIGTAITGLGLSPQRAYGSWPQEVDPKLWNAESGGAAAGFTQDGTDVLVVGHDQDAVETLAEAWERSVLN